MAQQQLAKRENELPVLARIGIGDPGYFVSSYSTPRIAKQFAVQLSLHLAGVVGRHQFGTRQVGFQKVVGDDHATGRVAIEQMMAAGNPEVVHGRRGSVLKPARSSAPSGSASSSTSMNENALLWPCPAPSRSCNFRNDSVTSPCLTERWTATSVLTGCVQSDSAKATSSSAATRAVARSGAPKRSTSWPASSSTNWRRSSPVAGTICTSVDHAHDFPPRKPPRNAAFSLPVKAVGSRS